MESPDGVWQLGLHDSVGRWKVALAISSRSAEGFACLHELRIVSMVGGDFAAVLSQWGAR